MPSVLNVDTLTDAAGTGPVALTKQQAAKMWLTYNQTTPAISDSFSVSSVSDDATGRFTVNRTNAFSNANYCSATFSMRDNTNAANGSNISRATDDTKTTTAMKFATTYYSGSNNANVDVAENCVQSMGDLA